MATAIDVDIDQQADIGIELLRGGCGSPCGSATPVVIDTTAYVVSEVVGSDTVATISLPEGSYSVGQHLLMHMEAADGTNINSAVQAAGWTKLTGTINDPWYWRRIDGTEGWTGDGEDTSAVTVENDEVVCAAVVMLLCGLYDEYPDNPGPWFTQNPGETADPDPLPDPGWDSPMLVVTSLVTDGSLIASVPSGYTTAGTMYDTGIGLNMSYLNMSSQAVDPPTYTATGVEKSYTVILRGVDDATEFTGDVSISMGVDHQADVGVVVERGSCWEPEPET